MASRKFKLIAASGAIALVGGYGLYVSAQAVPPELAQAPMNITNVIPPAFIMGLDNSGSMSSDETLFRTANGVGRFSNGSFFDSNGDARESGTAFPKAMDSGSYADYYAAARNPKYNRAYFDPTTTYRPWRLADGSFETDSNPASAVEDRRGGGTTFNFTTYLQVRETWPSGTTMPIGTTYLNDDNCNRAPGSNNTTNGWVTLTQEKTFTNNCATTFRYYPARVYLDLTDTPPVGFDLNQRRLVRNVGPNGADMWRYDYLASNFTTGGAAAVQNFANYWTYSGNRNRAMISAMTESLADVSNMRIGYFEINPPPPAGNVTMRNMNSLADKQALYTQMRALNASGSTPTRRATAYMVSQFTRTDAGAPVQLQCQKNAGMLFTDGFTNDNNSGITGIPRVGGVGDEDGALPPPYGGGVGSARTIADYAMYGYNTVLRTGAGFPTGQVPVPNACNLPNPPNGMDCKRDLHMNFYGVTLGARGQVYDVNQAATADPYTTPPFWNATGNTNLQPSNVDDIWHAAINSRGEFINATTPSDITAAMRRILAAVNQGTTPSGTSGVTGARIGAGSLSVQPSYESTNNGIDWYGRLTAEAVSTNPLTGEAAFVEAWEASASLALQGAAARDIRFGRTTTSVVPAVSNFTSGNVSLNDLCSNPLRVVSCTPAAIQALATGMNNARAVAYLRGDRTDEPLLRTRTAILGDIVNSSPVVASATDDYGYRAFGGSLATSYSAFLTAKKAANRPLVFVGANDGMFHVFDGRAAFPGGNEVMGYVPATALGHMGNLLFPYNAVDQNNQKFQHRYFVDGPITVSDIYTGGVWKTIAVGTSGAGGRSVFALDVTNPNAITVLWEINNLITGAPGISGNIGHVLSRPVIVPVKSTAGVVSWKVIFGNGYNSSNQQARLFVVDAASGASSTILAAEASPPTFNGIGSVAVVDRKQVNGGVATAGRDGYSDTVYAADQNGAVWKFDLLTNSLALSSPLYVARDGANNRQSITGGLTTATGPSGGVMVYFGTGSFSFTGDPSNNATQTLYAVLDTGASVTGRSQLLAQSVGTTAAGFRSTTTNQMTAGRSGWYLDLPPGERFVGNPRIESGIVFFPTYEPTSNATTDCSVGGKNWLYGLNSLSGGAALTSVRVGSPTGAQPATATGAVALNTTITAPVRDVSALTAPRISPLTGTPTQAQIDAALAAQCSMVIRVAGSEPLYLPRPCGRQSWRQVR